MPGDFLAKVSMRVGRRALFSWLAARRRIVEVPDALPLSSARVTRHRWDTIPPFERSWDGKKSLDTKMESGVRESERK